MGLAAASQLITWSEMDPSIVGRLQASESHQFLLISKKQFLHQLEWCGDDMSSVWSHWDRNQGSRTSR